MAILTAVGEARLANATALGVPWNITQLGVGDGNGAEPMPIRTQTALVNERRRAPLNQLSIDANNSSIIIAEQVIPEDVGGWWIREIGLYDEAGDLVAVANCPPTYKPELAQGSGRTQVVRLNILVSSTQSISLKIDPSVVLATRAYADTLIVDHLAATDPHSQYQLRGGVVTLSATAAITAAQLGLLLLDASGGARTFTLPAANAAIGVREVTLRRVDVTSNALAIAASGTDKIMLDTTAEAAGQATTELLFAGDFLRLRSDGAGKWWCVGQAQLPGSIAGGLLAYTGVGNHTFTVPAVLRSGRRVPTVTVVGGGGAGASGSSNGRGGGGGAGGCAKKKQALSGVASVAVTVGAGGQFGSTSGGTTSFGVYCSATGGFGGQQYAGSNSAGGGPGAGAGGTLNIAGGFGSDGPVQGGAGIGGSGDGGVSIFGGGVRSSGGGGLSGAAPGSGGGGSETTTTQGMPGVVIIEW
ncbi:phage tail protein [Stutzerimonas zhaodongensis]|uniref:phage tail protein n=1 Tax=Stutzerimonas zhaodongensis TaxID=1176257 RepID=UPI003CC66CEC